MSSEKVFIVAFDQDEARAMRDELSLSLHPDAIFIMVVDQTTPDHYLVGAEDYIYSSRRAFDHRPDYVRTIAALQAKVAFEDPHWCVCNPALDLPVSLSETDVRAWLSA